MVSGDLDVGRQIREIDQIVWGEVEQGSETRRARGCRRNAIFSGGGGDYVGRRVTSFRKSGESGLEPREVPYCVVAGG